MKQIIPFQKELLFKTKVSEITSISLEHTLSLKNNDIISGEFHISGDYKMTEGSINRENFSFTLPFDIELDTTYDISSITIDIDNFYYEVINNESLKVNIDVFVEGEKLDPPKEESEIPQEEPIREKEVEEQENNTKETIEEQTPTIEYPEVNIDRDDLEENIQYKKTEKQHLEENKEFNIFENIDNSDTYVTYHVYIVKEEDTIDKIIDKYGVTKEDIALYNNLDEIKPGTKLIIPNKNE